MKKYSFVTVWKLRNTSLDETWKTIKAVEEWPQWWSAIASVITEKEGDADGLGKICLFTFKTALPYSLSFKSEAVQIVKNKILAGKASGELDGSGIWTFTEEGSVIRIQYNWDVQTKKAWMNLLSPLLRPVFKWNHDIVMRWGLKGLVKRLNAEMVD